MKLKYKIWLDDDGKIFGEGPYQLLLGVKSSGSLAQAAKDLNMSYSHAHGLMKNLATKLGFSLIEGHSGGIGGGGARITAQAEDLMRRYESFMHESVQSLETIFERHFGAQAESGEAKSSDLPVVKQMEDEEHPVETIEDEEAYEQQAETVSTYLPAELQPLQLVGHDVVSLIGGGGKSSIMYALAEELSLSGAKVILTTTTKIMLPTHGSVNRLIISNEQGIINQLRQGIAPGEVIAVGGGVSGGKLLGIAPELVDSLSELALADYILVEADGSARRPLKASAAHEPVIPQSSTVVLAICGIDALDVPLTDEYFHRVAEISAICGLPPHAVMDSEAIAAVMFSEVGGRKNVPRGAHWLPVINKIDRMEDVSKARRIARALVQAGAQDVVFASTLHNKLKVRLWSKNWQ